VSLIHLGASALEQNQLETAYRYIEEGLEAVRNVGVVRQIINGLSQLGYIWLQMGNPEKALVYLQEGLKMARESESPRNIYNLQCSMTKTYLVLNDLNAALNALREALSLAQSLGGYPQKVEVVSIAAAFYQSLGLNEQAAIWAGMFMGDIELDQLFITPFYLKLEATLGVEAYQRALEQGKALILKDVFIQVIGLLDQLELDKQ
jgi:tetratricopeptide (TPR) repeat protein